MKTSFYFFLLFVLASCGTIVNYDYDKNINLASYKTYNYYPTIESGLNELDEKRIISITDSILKLKGMFLSNEPQLFINFYVEEYITHSRNTLGVGYGSIGRNSSIGISGGIPIGGKEVNQLLTIDGIDAQKDALVWQAKAESRFKENSTPLLKEKHYQGVLQKIYKKFPY